MNTDNAVNIAKVVSFSYIVVVERSFFSSLFRKTRYSGEGKITMLVHPDIKDKKLLDLAETLVEKGIAERHRKSRSQIKICFPNLCEVTGS